ncbi:unnamed protein product [Miscanthus lutarioriparius]|uniref:Uncharacterized protein n=1 Tax=Miscanthus lutarioriparius TaxID=422564 RepID=A0A811P8Y7_9POAL|nr:unnamed protein product [Miscanthus lutarioriparius]
MASTAKGRAGGAPTAGLTEEDKAEWWLRFNNGVPVDDGDDSERRRREGAERRATYAVAGCEEVEMQMGPGDGRAETVARGVKAEMVARGGGKAETEASGVGGKRRSSPRFADPAALDGNCETYFAELIHIPRRFQEATRSSLRSYHGGGGRQSPSVPRLNVDGTEVQNNMSQAQSPPPVLKGPERVYQENENLKLQLTLKTTELKQEEIRRLQLELIIKSKETESLQKQIEDLKAENEQLRKNVSFLRDSV